MPFDTALHKAAYEGDAVECVALLMKDNFVNVRGAQGRTPFHRALGAGSLSCTQILLSHKADLNMKDDMERTCLHWAVMGAAISGSNDCVNLLLRFSNSSYDYVNAVTTTGFTALHFAANHHNKHTYKLLVDMGADTSTSNEDGYTPAMLLSSSEELQTSTPRIESVKAILRRTSSFSIRGRKHSTTS